MGNFFLCISLLNLKYFKLPIMKTTFLILLILISSQWGLCQNQIEIDSVTGIGKDALHIVYTEGDGVSIRKAEDDGFEVDHAVRDGFEVSIAGRHGFRVFQAGDDGVFINSAGGDGVRVGSVMENGINILDADKDGIQINSAGFRGISILNSAGTGLDISHNGDYGVRVSDAARHGLYVLKAGWSGLWVENAASEGIHVHNSDGLSMNIQGVKTANPAGPSDHIAQIFNRASGGGPDVLALKVGVNAPGELSNFITFFDASNNALGRIEGNGSGGIVFKSGGADFAEYLPVVSAEENFKPGDIVGIHSGQISLHTNGADQVMVITDQALVVGNQPQSNDEIQSGYEKVSFIGQVPVYIRGPVHSGDWIIPSGKNDGIGLAISNEEVQPHHQLVGQAWENSSEFGVKRINVAIGRDQSKARNAIIGQLQETLKEQKRITDDLQSQINELKSMLLK